MIVPIIAHPNSKNPRIHKDLFGRMNVYVNAPPQEGKANKAIVEILAKHFGVRRNKVILISGAKSTNKVFEIIRK